MRDDFTCNHNNHLNLLNRKFESTDDVMDIVENNETIHNTNLQNNNNIEVVENTINTSVNSVHNNDLIDNFHENDQIFMEDENSNLEHFHYSQSKKDPVIKSQNKIIFNLKKKYKKVRENLKNTTYRFKRLNYSYNRLKELEDQLGQW